MGQISSLTSVPLDRLCFIPRYDRETAGIILGKEAGMDYNDDDHGNEYEKKLVKGYKGQDRIIGGTTEK